jgi:hypothetical protein
MITIKITKTTVTPYEETTNFIVSKTPTNLRGKEGNYGDEKPLFDEKYAPSVAKKVKTETIAILEQNIEDDSSFDLAAVIVAINKLG